jgi:hypothetical protein
MRPARLTITSAAMFARLPALVTIPIYNCRCFTQRFSPTRFILNASDSNCSPQSLSARIQDKTCPIQFNPPAITELDCGLADEIGLRASSEIGRHASLYFAIRIFLTHSVSERYRDTFVI